jgi:signal transduction histidine kinase
VDPAQAYEELSVGVTRMESIMKALQAANRFAQGQVAARARDADLREIAQKTLEDVRGRMRHGDIRADIGEGAMTVHVDPELLGGAIAELLENATQYAPGTPVTLRVRAEAGRATVEVEDSGKGIDKRDLPHMFEKFTRGKDASQFKTGGNGLGLYIVRTIIEMFGGTIAVRSKEGAGTTFVITLPLA